MNSSKIQNEMLVFELKQFIEDLKESIKAVIVCVQIVPITRIFDQILLLKSSVKMLTICPE